MNLRSPILLYPIKIMDGDQFSILNQQYKTLQNSLDVITNDITSDREKLSKEIANLEEHISEFRLRLSAVESQVDELRKQSRTNSKNVQDKVAEIVAPMVTETQDLKQVIQSKKFVVLDAQKIKKQVKKWYYFWKN